MNYILNNINLIIIFISIIIFLYLLIGLRLYYFIKNQNIKLPKNVNVVIDCLCYGIFDLNQFYPDGIISIVFAPLPCRISIYNDIIEINYTQKIILYFHEINELFIDNKKPPSGQIHVSEWRRLIIHHNNNNISKKIELYTDRYYNEFARLKEVVDNVINVAT